LNPNKRIFYARNRSWGEEDEDVWQFLTAETGTLVSSENEIETKLPKPVSPETKMNRNWQICWFGGRKRKQNLVPSPFYSSTQQCCCPSLKIIINNINNNNQNSTKIVLLLIILIIITK